MPKRNRSKEEKYRRKLRKYEKKLCTFEDDRRSRSPYSPPRPAPTPRYRSRSRSRSRSPLSEPSPTTPRPHGQHRVPDHRPESDKSRQVLRRRRSPRADTPTPDETQRLPSRQGTPTRQEQEEASKQVSPTRQEQEEPNRHLSPTRQAVPNGSNSPTLQAGVNPVESQAVDPDLLEALGCYTAEEVEWGEDIFDDLPKRWNPILCGGLKADTKDQLIKKILFPKNCPLIKPPLLNPEISAVLNDSAKSRDSRILKKQTQIGSALAIIGETMTEILKNSTETAKILRNLSDVALLLADSHFLETDTRRSLVMPMIDKSLLDSFKGRKRDSHLFGDKLSEFIKSSRGIQKTGKLIQPAAATSSRSSLNSKGPVSRYHPRTSQVGRASETRAFPYRRRGPPPPSSQSYRAPPLPTQRARPASATMTAPPPQRRAAQPRRK